MTEMNKQRRRKFDPAFKLQVVRMIREQNVSLGQVCRDMDLVDSAVRRWVEQYDAEQAGGPGQGKPLTGEQQRIRELEAENRRLKEDGDAVKKSVSLLCPGTAMSYEVIARVAKKAQVSRLCRLLEVSRSGFYAWRVRVGRPEAVCATGVRLKAAFEASGRCYGSRRLTAALRAQGVEIGRHRVRTLMRRHALQARWRRKFAHTTDSRHDLAVADNVLDRQFQPTTPDRAWVCDITYIRTRSGWLYLAAVLDLYSRRIVGWATSASMPAELVCSALHMALSVRQPPPGLIVHSDRGSQYASLVHQAMLQQHGIVCSMSRRANCWDNAVMERFFLSLKTERVWQRDYANHAEATADIADYIVRFYNPVRLHSTLGYRSPADFERQTA
ncbi:IS3 family transposase [Sphaerotilus sulfidivorans]